MPMPTSPIVPRPNCGPPPPPEPPPEPLPPRPPIRTFRRSCPLRTRSSISGICGPPSGGRRPPPILRPRSSPPPPELPPPQGPPEFPAMRVVSSSISVGHGPRHNLCRTGQKSSRFDRCFQCDKFLRHRRMHRDGAIEVFLGGAHLDGDAGKLDHFARARRDDVTPHDPARRAADDQLHQRAVRLACKG